MSISHLVAASYMKICGRRNPDLSKCVLESVAGLQEKFKTGMPEIDAPSLDPLVIKHLPFADTPQLKAYGTDVKLYGLADYDAKSVKIDLVNKRLDIEVSFKKIIIDADYDVKAKILVPIEGHGPIHIVTGEINESSASADQLINMPLFIYLLRIFFSDDVYSTVVMKYKLIKRKGKEYMFFQTMTMLLDIKDFDAVFKPSNNDTTITTAINAAIGGGRQEILETIRPTLEKVISAEILRIANNICTHFTYDELFPERE